MRHGLLRAHDMLHAHFVQGFFWLSLLSCNDQSAKKIAFHDFKTIQIEINSPASCYNEIQMNNSGNGISVVGYRSLGQNEKVRNKKTFNIIAHSDQENVSNTINKIIKRGPVSSSFGFDLIHFYLMIDGKKSIDVYGGDSLLDDLLVTLAPYARVEQKEQCDFFQLFHKSADFTP